MKTYTIGVDLGGTNIKAGLVDEAHHIVDSVSCKTNLPRPEHEVEAEIAALCSQLAQRAGLDMAAQIESVGIGTPGSVNPHTGVVEFNANFGYRNWPLVSAMEKLLPCRVYIENDANAAAYGEYIAGAAQGAKYAIAVTLGTGIGGGIIIDGKIYAGFNHFGGELGHEVIVYNGRPCTCGRKGCLEAYASATGLINMTKEAMEAHKESKLWEVAKTLDEVNGKTAFDAMRLGDPAGKEVVDAYIGYLGCGLSNFVNIFQPEVILIGGGICKEGENLLAPLREVIKKESYGISGYESTQLRTCALGNDAGTIGAAFLWRMAE